MEQDDNKLTFWDFVFVMAFILYACTAESIALWFCDLIGI